MHKTSFSAKVNLNLTLELPYAYYSAYTLSVGVVGLAEYVVLTPFFIFTEEGPDFVPDDVE